MNDKGTSAILAIFGDMSLGEIKAAMELYHQYSQSVGGAEDAMKAFLVYQGLKDAYVDIEKCIWMPEIFDEVKKLVDEYRVGGG